MTEKRCPYYFGMLCRENGSVPFTRLSGLRSTVDLGRKHCCRGKCANAIN